MNSHENGGEFQEFASLLKRVHPESRYDQNFNHRHSSRGGRSNNLKHNGRGRGFFNRQGGHLEEIHSTYRDDRDDDYCQVRSNESFWPAANVEEGNSDFIRNGPKRHFNSVDFRHIHNPQFVSNRARGRGNNQQNFRFRGRGLWKSNYRGNGHSRKNIHDCGYEHHSVYNDEDLGNTQVLTNDVRVHPECSTKHISSNVFGHRETLVGKGGGPFRGNSFKRRFVNFINKSPIRFVNSNEVATSNTTVLGDLSTHSHDGHMGDGIEPNTCSKGSLIATVVGGSASLPGKKLQKQKCSTLTQSLLDCKHASQSSAPLQGESGKETSFAQEKDVTLNGAPLPRKKLRKPKRIVSTQSLLDCKHASQSSADVESELGKECTRPPQKKSVTIDNNLKEHETSSQKESIYCHQEVKPTLNTHERPQEWESREAGTSLQDENATFSLDQRHHERAFISCIGGGNRKRRRSAAVRDFPVGCGSLRISVVKKVKIISKDSEPAPEDLMVTHSIAEVGSRSNLELISGITSNGSIAGLHGDGTGLDANIEDDGILDVGSWSNRELIDEITSNVSIADAHGDVTRPDANKADDGIPESVQSGIKSTSDESSKMSPFQEDSSFGDANRMDVTKADGSTELLQSVCRSPTKASKTALSQGNTRVELVPPRSEVHIERGIVLMEEMDQSGLVQGNFEIERKKCNEPVISEEHVVLDSVQSMDLFQKECNAIVDTVVQIKCNEHAHVTFESLHMEVPSQGPVIGMPMQVHTSSQCDNSDGEKEKHTMIVKPSCQKAKKKALRNQKTVFPLKESLLQSTRKRTVVVEQANTSTGIRNQNNASKKVKVQNLSEFTERSLAVIPYIDSTIGSSINNKNSGNRLVHKGRSRVKHSQTSRSLDSLMLHNDDVAKGLGLETTGGSARSLVKRTLHEYESIRKSLVKSNDVRRADLDAASLLKERGKWRNCEEKIIGEVPGVEVGDQFSFRMEMLIIGLHRQVQGGIDYIPATKRDNKSPLATSIVASGGYEDDKDDGNVLIYSGQGGNNAKGNKKQESNQVLARGNLAMSNSMKEGTPVRVIRGISDLTSPSSKIYTYDGLYDVVDFRLESRATGYGVYHFTLIRRPGQPQVGLSILSSLKKKGAARPYLLLDDISGGQERLPICVVNEVDEEPAPMHFTYIPKIKHPGWYAPLVPQGCNCAGVCDEETCSCAVKNGGELPFNEKAYILRDKKVVYECGTSCSCSSACQNRVSQKGLRYRLEVFKTKNRGWGVRSLDSIQSGGFICEYTGELLTDAEAEQRIGNDEYLFDLGNECNPFYEQSNSETNAEDVAYTIDAKDLGNVARFINHSCSPNLYAQNVLYDSDDLRFPHVMLFAMESIPPMRELTYDYNYSLDQVRDANGNVKIKACYCGAQDCQGRLY